MNARHQVRASHQNIKLASQRFRFRNLLVETLEKRQLFALDVIGLSSLTSQPNYSQLNDRIADEQGMTPEIAKSIQSVLALSKQTYAPENAILDLKNSVPDLK